MMKQTTLINTDLMMSPGKMAVQVGHGVTLYMENINNPFNPAIRHRFNKWASEGMCKIVLQATEDKMHKTVNKLNDLDIVSYVVRDYGLNEVIPNSFTALTVEPLNEELHKKLFSRFKLI